MENFTTLFDWQKNRQEKEAQVKSQNHGAAG
jgi:hypothetical protein